MTSTEQIRRKYDELADSYEDIYFYVADAGRQLIDYANPAPGSRVLDVGAGRGAVARAALARGCVVTAIDASAGMVERLRSDFPSITARQLDAGRLDFADGSFDLVTAGFVVQVLDDPAVAIAEMRRVLVPGGMIALSVETQAAGRMQWLHDLNVEFFSPPAAAADEPVLDQPAPDVAANQDAGPLTAEQLDALLADAGFVNLTREPIEMPLSMPDPQALWDWLYPLGFGEALQTLPAERSAAARSLFFAEAEQMNANGGIVLKFAATLHRALRPQ